jgi:tRNA threonylcarbamoyladenosine biosynthesis protein TsaB
MKPILAVSTSGKLCSVALLINNEDYISFNFNKNQVHSEKLIGMIDIVLKESNIKLNDCEGIAVSLGPGSFTGLRIGLSAVKALAFGAGLPIYPISEFDAIAMFANNVIKNNSTFNIAVKVNRDEVYFAKYKNNVNEFEIINKIEIITLDEILNYCKPNEPIFGNINYKDIIYIDGIDAFYIAKYALLYGKDLLTLNFDYLEPDYLKNFVPRGVK